MKHAELIEAIATDMGSKALAREAVDAVVRAIWYGLKRDGIVSVRDLGTFELKDLPARRMKTVESDEVVAVAPSKLCAFRMAKPLKRVLRET